MYCEHDRLATACEECAFLRGLNLGLVRPGAVLYPPQTPARRIAETDLDVPIGQGRTVHVKAGDPIPIDLLDHLDKPAPKAKADRAKPPTSA